jgi:hypothetical protein
MITRERLEDVMLGCAVAWTVPMTVAVGYSTPRTSLLWVAGWLAGMGALAALEQRWARVIAAREEHARRTRGMSWNYDRTRADGE